jgi:outer membrane protein TolC
MKFLSPFILCIFLALPLKAETYNLTLEESIELAKEKSYTMRLLVQDIKIAEYNLKSTTSRLKTHISMDLTLPEFGEVVSEYYDKPGDYYRTKSLKYSGGLTINQPLPTDGRLFIQSGLSTFKNFYDGTQSSNLNTRIGFTQPLDALYGYNAIRTALKSAQLAYERASRILKRSELSLVTQVSQYYYNLLSFQKSAEIAQLNLDRQTEAYEISKNKYEAGLIREVDALQMEVDLAEAQSNYDMALFNQSSALNSFKELIGIELDDTVILSSELQYKVVVVDPEQAVKLALENRSELRERDIDIEVQKLDLKRQKAQGMVRGNLEAYVEKVGVAIPTTNIKIPNSIENSFTGFKDSPYSYGIGFTISIPILDWGENRALVRASEARIRQSTLNKEDSQRNIETEVRNIVASISSNLKRLQLLEKNVSVAEKSFEITLQRFSDGDIDSQSLALERTRLNTAYTSHLSAYIGYQMTLTELMRATLYDFQNEEGVK